MKRFLSIFLFLTLLLTTPSTTFAGTCTGSSNCSACTTCNYCEHCNEEGGSCGVCGGKEKKKSHVLLWIIGIAGVMIGLSWWVNRKEK